MDKLQISAKKLGELAMPDFCPRCFWICAHMKGELPFQIFPQIFGHIDRYTKRVVHVYIDEHGVAPPWLEILGDVNNYIDPPNSASFRMPFGDNILLTGEADAILKCKDGSLIIADYKTAFAKTDDDPLYPIYKVQLNAYALLASHCGFGTAASLALIYMEPWTGEESAKLTINQREDGFALGFHATVLEVPLNSKIITALAEKAWKIYCEPSCPEGTKGCKNCRQTKELNDVQMRVLGSKAAYAAAFK